MDGTGQRDDRAFEGAVEDGVAGILDGRTTAEEADADSGQISAERAMAFEDDRPTGQVAASGQGGSDADADADVEDEGDGLSAEERAEKRASAERAFLRDVIEDVRARSADSFLVTPSRWTELGIMPDHFSEEDAEMFVHDRLKALQEEQERASKPEPPACRSATRAVGIPRRLRGAEDASQTPAAPDGREEAGVEGGLGEEPAERTPVLCDSGGVVDDGGGCCSDDEFEPFEITVRGRRGIVRMEDGEAVFFPYGNSTEDDEEPDASSIKLLQGRSTYYLYDGGKMTDAFANWSFMAAEDDDAAVLATLARQESRTYPRPFHDASLKNIPFLFSDERIEDAWRAVRESGAYPDVQETFASNGDRYFYSTDHLSPRHAAALAEWHSVTVYENV